MTFPINVDATWVNPSTVQMDAGELRRADAAAFTGEGGTFGVHGGVTRHGDSSLLVSVDGSDNVTIQPGAVLIPGNAVAGTGPYRTGIASAVTGALSARNATNPRIDLVVFRQLDTDVVGTHGAYTARIDVLPGTPSATPVVPTLPSMAVELARITVPATGGGASTVDSTHRSYAAAAGGEIAVPTATQLPTGGPLWQRAVALDTGSRYRWNGTAWVGPGWLSYTPLWRNAGGAGLSVGSGSLVGAYKYLDDDTVRARFRMVRASDSNVGSSYWTFSLPVTPKSGTRPVGVATILHGTSFLGGFSATLYAVGGSDIVITRSDGTPISNTAPVTWAAGDEVLMSIIYEV